MFDTLFVEPIFNLLLFFYSLVGDFGVSIILFTVIVKLILWPTVKTQYSQTRMMRKIQPEIARLKKKAAGDKQTEYLMTSALYKKNGIKMSQSFISALIQLPILLAMFRVIQMVTKSSDVFTQYGYDFINNLEPIKAIIEKREVFKPMLLGIIDLSKVPFKFEGWNAVFLISVLLASSYIQKLLTDRLSNTPTNEKGDKRSIKQIFSEAADGKDPNQSEINLILSSKMNKILPVMLFFSFGWIYGAVSFYSLTSNLITLIQYKLLEKEDIPEVQSVEDSEIQERLKKAETAQILNDQRLKTIKTRPTSTSTPSGEIRVTRIKAKK